MSYTEERHFANGHVIRIEHESVGRWQVIGGGALRAGTLPGQSRDRARRRGDAAGGAPPIDSWRVVTLPAPGEAVPCAYEDCAGTMTYAISNVPRLAIVGRCDASDDHVEELRMAVTPEAANAMGAEPQTRVSWAVNDIVILRLREPPNDDFTVLRLTSDDVYSGQHVILGSYGSEAAASATACKEANGAMVWLYDFHTKDYSRHDCVKSPPAEQR